MSESKSGKQTSLLSFFGQSKQCTKKINSQTAKSGNGRKRTVEVPHSGAARTTLKSRRKKHISSLKDNHQVETLPIAVTETAPKSPFCSSQITPISSSSTREVTPLSAVHDNPVKESIKGKETKPLTTLSFQSSDDVISTDNVLNEAPNEDEGKEPNHDSETEYSSVQQTKNDSLPDANVEEFEPELSEYELLRKRNIERNNRRLAALGLLGNPWGSTGETQTQEQKQKKQRRRKVGGDTTKYTASMPTRRSTRNRRSVLKSSTLSDSILEIDNSQSETIHKSQKLVEEIQQQEEEEEFTVSPVVNYAMSASMDKNLVEPMDFSPSVASQDIASLKPLGSRLLPPNGLSAIYSLQFYPTDWSPRQRPDDTWIAGAGKAGIVSLWDCNWSKRTSRGSTTEEDIEVDGIDPILSWKAHGGRWVADVQFLPDSSNSHNAPSLSSKGPPSRLLTAANDGCICLWDLTAVSVQNGAPKMLCKTGKELHKSGIFAMDVRLDSMQNAYICTGSKDKTVAVTQLDSIGRGSSVGPIWLSDYHCSKVGAVAFRGEGSTLLASAADDGTVAIHDYRVDGQNGKNKLVAEITDAHSRPHSVVWNPLSEHEVMTAGHDHRIFTFDIRHVKQSLATFHGHVPSNSRCKKIHHPTFFNPCGKMTNSEQFILTGGDCSHSLSMFKNIDSGGSKEQVVSVYSRGKLPAECGDAGSLATQGERVAAVVDGGEVLLLTPQIKQ